MKKYPLPGRERLKSRKVINSLFKAGERIQSGDLQLIYLPLSSDKPQDTNIKFGISVPRRRFKRAVDRNKIKRQLREVWRFHRPLVMKQLDASQLSFAFFYIYIGRDMKSTKELSVDMKSILDRWIKKIAT